MLIFATTNKGKKRNELGVTADSHKPSHAVPAAKIMYNDTGAGLMCHQVFASPGQLPPGSLAVSDESSSIYNSLQHLGLWYWSN